MLQLPGKANGLGAAGNPPNANWSKKEVSLWHDFDSTLAHDASSDAHIDDESAN
jgi:hypothetical protein